MYTSATDETLSNFTQMLAPITLPCLTVKEIQNYKGNPVAVETLEEKTECLKENSEKAGQPKGATLDGNEEDEEEVTPAPAAFAFKPAFSSPALKEQRNRPLQGKTSRSPDESEEAAKRKLDLTAEEG